MLGTLRKVSALHALAPSLHQLLVVSTILVLLFFVLFWWQILILLIVVVVNVCTLFTMLKHLLQDILLKGCRSFLRDLWADMAHCWKGFWAKSTTKSIKKENDKEHIKLAAQIDINNPRFGIYSMVRDLQR